MKRLKIVLFLTCCSFAALGQDKVLDILLSARLPNPPALELCAGKKASITLEIDDALAPQKEILLDNGNGTFLSVGKEPDKQYSKDSTAVDKIVFQFSQSFIDSKESLKMKPNIVYTDKNSVIQRIPFVFKECVVKKEEVVASPPKIATEDYLEYISGKLRERRVIFEKYKLAKKNDTIFVFLNTDLRPIEGTALPECNPKNTYYMVYIIYAENEYSKAEIALENNLQSDGLNIGGTETSTDEKELKLADFNTGFPQGPFQSGVDFKVSLFKKENDKDVLANEKSFTIDACDKPIHVTILGGFYYSTLNNPTKVVEDVIPGTNINTLYADNSKSQRALTVMALFYPIPRNRDYAHKSLSFMQKWGIAFGTKLSQDLFNDLLLGANYEFTKGGSFTAGVHYGEHSVVRGYDNFEFGKTPYVSSTAFSNAKMTQRWDFGFFIGVTIDFRVVAAMRLAGKRENDLNNNSGD